MIVVQRAEVGPANSVEPLFDSTHQALSFAYTHTASQTAQCAVAESQLAEFGRQRYERLRVVSRGLPGLDGVAQAGMIQRRVTYLPVSAVK